MTPPLLSAITLEFFTVKLIFSVKSQLRLVGSHNTSLGVVAHGALELGLFQIRKCHFLVTIAFFWLYLLRKGAYRDFLHIILNHTTISNKLLIKVSAQKKGGEIMTATNMFSNFGGKWSSCPFPFQLKYIFIILLLKIYTIKDIYMRMVICHLTVVV